MIVPARELMIGDRIHGIADLTLTYPLEVLNIGTASVRNPQSAISVATHRGHTWLGRESACHIERTN